VPTVLLLEERLPEDRGDEFEAHSEMFVEICCKTKTAGINRDGKGSRILAMPEHVSAKGQGRESYDPSPFKKNSLAGGYSRALKDFEVGNLMQEAVTVPEGRWERSLQTPRKAIF